MTAIVLALCSSLVYGVSDFLGGLKSRSLPLLSVLLVSQGAALALLAAATLVSTTGPPAGEYVLYGVLAGLFEAVGLAALYRGLAVGTMSIVAPLAATAPLFPLLAAVALGEAPAPIQAVGIVLALGGIGLISLEPGEVRTPALGRSVLFGLLTAAGFGGFLVAMDAASEGGVLWALLTARLTAVSAYALAFVVGRPEVGVGRGELPVLVAIGVMIIGADALYAVASTEGLLSVVAVLSSLYPLVTIVLARIYLKERLAPRQKLGAAATLCGAVAISAAA